MITRTEVEECFAVIDDEIVWHGGMNLLGKVCIRDRYKGSLVPKIEVIQNAIENRHTIQFKYYAPSGDSNRRIEPYYRCV